MTHRNGKTLAIVGCGAVTEYYYAPALQMLRQTGEIGDIVLFDPAIARAKSLAEQLRAKAASSFEALIEHGADLVIIASPPTAHAHQAIAALNAGLNVLCEKPIAPTAEEARLMIAAAEKAGRRLFAGHIRRYLPSTRLIAGLLSGHALGQIESVTCFEGGPFAWPVRSPAYFSKDVSGGGVFADIGIHCLDLLIWWLGVPDAVHYQDDAYGGVEANCLATMHYSGFDAKVRLSRDWHRPNRYVLIGSRGWLEWEVNEASSFRFGLTTGQAGAVVSADYHAPDTLSHGDDFVRAFASQIRALLASDPLSVTASDVLPAVSVIESCYAARQPLVPPWFDMTEQKRANNLQGQGP